MEVENLMVQCNANNRQLYLAV